LLVTVVSLEEAVVVVAIGEKGPDDPAVARQTR
jgi:hypothetical protein